MRPRKGERRREGGTSSTRGRLLRDVFQVMSQGHVPRRACQPTSCLSPVTAAARPLGERRALSSPPRTGTGTTSLHQSDRRHTASMRTTLRPSELCPASQERGSNVAPKVSRNLSRLTSGAGIETNSLVGYTDKKTCGHARVNVFEREEQVQHAGDCCGMYSR